jgi:voltage-gated potassium channel
MISPRQRFLRVIGALFLVVATGVIGYMAIEGWSFLDALYMTITTISTVGYKEIHELSTAGMIFSIVLIIGGVGVLFYTLTTVAQYLLEGQLANILGRRRMKEKISKLKGHIILCGYGQVGREVARVFKGEGTPFIVVDLDQEALAKAASDGYLYLQGNATSDAVLQEAGIHQARGLVAALGSDADNVYVTLSARGLRPDLFIVARGCADESESKLTRAGADRTISPHRLGGRHMAMLALRPLVVDFLDTAVHSRDHELVLEELKVGSSSPLAGVTIKEGQQYSGGTAILAVKKRDGSLLTHPSPETLLELGDELVIIGTREQLRALEGLV